MGLNQLGPSRFFSFFFWIPAEGNPLKINPGGTYLVLAWIHVGKYANINPSQTQVILPNFV